MSSEPRFSSQVPVIQEKDQQDASGGQVESSYPTQTPMTEKHQVIDSTDSTMSQLNDRSLEPTVKYVGQQERLVYGQNKPLSLSAPPAQKVTIFLVTFTLLILLMLIAYSLGTSHAVYQFIYGEGGAHLVSQSCTLALFCWGVAVALVRFMTLRKEQESLQQMNLAMHSASTPFNEPSLMLFDESLTGTFIQELSENIPLVSGYLEARTSLEVSRDRLVDQVDQLFKGIRAAMWLIPLSGFLGTVIGMSLTIGRFDELFMAANGDHVKLIGLSDLAPAIQGLGTAFDTTLLALALVIPLKLALLALENLSETLLQQIEAKLTLPYLQQALQTAEAAQTHSAHDMSSERLNTYIQALDTQAMSLNQHLADTSRYLLELRESLTSHPALSRQAQQVLESKVEGAIQQGFQHLQSGSNSSGDLMSPLQELVVQQQNANERLSLIQASLEAPIVLQRTPKKQES